MVQKSLPSGVKWALIDDQHVFLVPNSGSVLYRLNRKTFGDSKRKFLNSTPLRLLRYDRDHVALLEGRDHQSQLNLINVKTLKSKNPKPDKDFRFFRPSNMAYRVVAPNMLETPTAVMDMERGKLVAAKMGGGIPKLGTVDQRGVGGFRDTGAQKYFGRRVGGQQLSNYSGTQIARFSGTGYPSIYAPIVFSFRTETNATAERTRSTRTSRHETCSMAK